MRTSAEGCARALRTDLSTVARTLALERKRPVKKPRCRRCRSCRRCRTSSPQIRQRPHANCASHACRTQALRIYVFTGGAGTHARDTHATRAHTGTRMHGSLTTIPTHQRYTNAPTRTTTETANRAAILSQEKPPCWAGSFVVPTSSRQVKAARKVTHPSATLREVAEQRHGRRRSWPCTAFARHQESVAPNFTV
jgi:hypothetical protein